MLRSRSFLLGSGLLFAFSAIACSGDSLTTPGTTTLQITTSTAGTELDPDGYTVQVDAGAPQTIGLSASIQSPEVSPGDHAVQLAGMAPNCTVSGDNPRTVSVAAGQTATVSFAVTCGATTSGLQVTATTSGPAPDADGYIVTVDGAERGTLAASGTVNVDGLAPGDHVVGVSGVAANCQVQEDNPHTVTITPGAAASTAFTVSCAAPPPNAGTLRVTTASSGADLDADGYDLSVDGGKTQPIGVNGTATLANIAGGNHSVTLSGVASNCTVQGANPLAANVPAGATAAVSFTITCGATTGIIEVNVTSSGSPGDTDGYSAQLDNGGQVQPIASTGSATFVGVPAGNHTVALTGVAMICTVAGENPRAASVSAGNTATVTFSVTCGATTSPPIVFESGEEIFVINPDGTGRTKLTGGFYGSPLWAPDGSKIAAVNLSITELVVMNPDGSGLGTLISFFFQPPEVGLAAIFGFHWSPRGDLLAILLEVQSETDQEHQEIWTVRSDGTDARKLVDGTQPFWSPNGQEIGFLRPEGIYIIGSDGSGLRKLTDEPFGIDRGSPSWSPDGRTVAFAEYRNADGDVRTTGKDIMLIEADGTGRVNLTNGDGDNGSPVWAPDGSRIAFASNGHVDAINRDGSGRANLSRGSTDSSPVWSPDGATILFSRSNDIYAMNADGTGQRNLTNAPGVYSRPDWRR